MEDERLGEAVEPSELRRLEQTLDMTAETIQLAHQKFRASADTAAYARAAEVDAFLGFLRAEGIIDATRYRRATAEIEVELAPEIADLLEHDGPKYEVYEKIAEGGMGEIRVARDRQLRHRVALKLLKHAPTGPALARFLSEAQVTAQLDHPNIVPVYGLQVDDDDGVSFAMKMVAGTTLRDLLRETAEKEDAGDAAGDSHGLETRLEHFLKVCDAISYAHSKGVLHRDLKPPNIMIGAYGEVYVMDWGIAKLLDGDGDGDDGERETGQVSTSSSGEFTRADQLVGTPAYMSPEQAGGPSHELDERSDVFALGLMLYEIVTLRRAYSGDTMEDVLDQAKRAALGPVRRRDGRRPAPELVAIVERATAHDRDARYLNAEALAADIRRYLRGEAVSARPDTPRQALLRWMGRHRQVTLLAVLGVLLASAVAIALTLASRASALEDARERERQMTRFQSLVAQRANGIDRDFTRFEAMLVHLAEKAGDFLDSGDEVEPVYSDEDFRAGRGPADTGPVEPYSIEVSLDHPVYVLAAGVSEESALPLVRRLAPLAGYFRWILTTSALGNAASIERNLEAVLAQQPVPIRWAYIGLDEGIMFSYPGKGTYPADYDPRERPWYALGEHARTPQWGNAYIDLQGEGIVLPGVVAIYDAQGQPRGVAGMEITFDALIHSYLLPTTDEGIREAFLVDDRGRVIVRSSQVGAAYEAGQLHDAFEPEPYDVPEIAAAIERGDAGQVQIERDGESVIAGYQPIPVLGWYYVLEANVEDIVSGRVFRLSR